MHEIKIRKKQKRQTMPFQMLQSTILYLVPMLSYKGFFIKLFHLMTRYFIGTFAISLGQETLMSYRKFYFLNVSLCQLSSAIIFCQWYGTPNTLVFFDECYLMSQKNVPVSHKKSPKVVCLVVLYPNTVEPH